MSGLGPWATAVGVCVFFLCFARFLRAVYRGGRPDPAAIRVARGAAILPAVVTVGLLLGALAAMRFLPGAEGWIAYGMGGTALLGAIWATERGIRAVRASA